MYSNAEPGGYNYEFVDNSIPSRYQCTICMKVLRDARLTECCGQHYCDSCLAQWLRRKRTCPHCRKANLQSMLNKEKIREINELRIRCTNRKNGCAWVGELGALKGHHDSYKGCDYVKVMCTHKWCTEMLERKYLARHVEKECKYREHTCEHCGYRDTFVAITGIGSDNGRYHYARCDQYPLQCPNKCPERNIKRKDMKTHRNSCPLERLDCHFKGAGCTDKILRKDKENHEKSCVSIHLMMVLTSQQELARQNEELRSRNEDLASNNLELKADVGFLKACVLDLEDDVEDLKDDVQDLRNRLP